MLVHLAQTRQCSFQRIYFMFQLSGNYDVTAVYGQPQQLLQQTLPPSVFPDATDQAAHQ